MNDLLFGLTLVVENKMDVRDCPVYCPLCGEKQASRLDQLFTIAYDTCSVCCDEAEQEVMTETLQRMISIQ